MNRREFLRGAAACGLLSGCATTASNRFEAQGEIHAVLLHLGQNMWKEWLPAEIDAKLGDAPGYDRPHVKLALDEALWRKATVHMAEKGLNMVVVDIFETPRYFHLGWDEETVGYASGLNYFVLRTGELWWHDFLYTVTCVEGRGVRPWVWSDKGWKDDSYYTRCPKSVVQSDWYYDEFLGGFDVNNYTADHQFHRLKQFYRLEEAGFDQIPCGTNWVSGFRKEKGCTAEDVIGKLVKLGREVIPFERRLGFMMAPWAFCDTPENAAVCERGIDLFADALAGKIHPAKGGRVKEDRN